MDKEKDTYVDSQLFSSDTREFLYLLWRHNVRYVVVGGRAVIFYGHARMTGDIDVFYDRDADNAQALFDALKVFWKGDIPGIDRPQELEEDELILQFGRPPNRLDLISNLSAVDFEEAWEGRVTAVMKEQNREIPVHFIGIEELRHNKRSIARPKDRDDLQYLVDRFD